MCGRKLAFAVFGTGASWKDHDAACPSAVRLFGYAFIRRVVCLCFCGDNGEAGGDAAKKAAGEDRGFPVEGEARYEKGWLIVYKMFFEFFLFVQIKSHILSRPSHIIKEY